MKQYEIWWARLAEPVGRRPVLLLSRDEAHRYLGRVIVAEISSTIRGIPQEVVLGHGEGLSRRCAVNLDNVRTVQVSNLVERMGRVHIRRVREIKRAFGCAVMWTELTRIGEPDYS